MNNTVILPLNPATFFYDNIADLRSGTACSGVVIIKGYYSDGDGGEGQFYWDPDSTDADNNGTIIKADAVIVGRWKRFLYDAVPVAWFGAVGDGIVDDAAAITAAITFAGESGIGLVLLKPNAIHGIASTIYIGANNAHLTLKGSGSHPDQSRIKAIKGFNGEMVKLLSGTIEALSIQGCNLTATMHRGISIGKAKLHNLAEPEKNFHNDVNPKVQIKNIAYAGGLYDFIFSEYQYNFSLIENITALTEVGHAMIWLDTKFKYPASFAVTLKNIQLQNSVEQPLSGKKKKWGLYISRTTGLSLTSAIIVNFDINIELGKATTIRNESLSMEAVQISENRIFLDNSKYQLTKHWLANSHYSKGDYIQPSKGNKNGHYYLCTAGPLIDNKGLSGNHEPSWPSKAGTVVDDGNLEWTELGCSAIWLPATDYNRGAYVRPTSDSVNGHFYICTKTGTSSDKSEPRWPSDSGRTVKDGSARWKEVGCSIAVKLRINDNINLNRFIIDGTIVAFYSRQNNTTIVSNSRVAAKDVAYLQVAGQSSFDYVHCRSMGDIKLTADGKTTHYSAKHTTIANDSIGDVPDTRYSFYSNDDLFVK